MSSWKFLQLTFFRAIDCKHPQTISAEYSKAERADLNMLLQVGAQKFKHHCHH